MKYLLSQEEFDELTRKAKNLNEDYRKNLLYLCQQVADNKPILRGWGKLQGEEDETPRPWGCIKSMSFEWYCDQCPVRDICPEDNKHWSK